MNSPGVKSTAIQLKDLIFNTDCCDATLPYGLWTIRALRLYHKTPSKTAWTPLYFLIDPEGYQWGGYSNLNSFIRWSTGYIKRREGQHE